MMHCQSSINALPICTTLLTTTEIWSASDRQTTRTQSPGCCRQWHISKVPDPRSARQCTTVLHSTAAAAVAELVHHMLQTPCAALAPAAAAGWYLCSGAGTTSFVAAAMTTWLRSFVLFTWRCSSSRSWLWGLMRTPHSSHQRR